MCWAELQGAIVGGWEDGPSAELELGPRNCCLLTDPEEEEDESRKFPPLSGKAVECLRFSGAELFTPQG